MKIVQVFVPTLVTVAIGLTAFASAARHKTATRPAVAPVVVELFTSEGCSSCPPADAVLASLAKRRAGAAGSPPVIVLSEHVDYWDRLGWRDPFSSAALTARQNEYAAAFRLDSPYTPQMVVDGRAEFVGSDAARAHAAIADAARRPRARVTLTATRVPAGLSLHIAVADLPPGIRPDADVVVALTEDNLMSRVTRGENAGRSLPHVGVVRRLTRVGTVGAEGFTTDTTIPLAPEWRTGNLRAVAFVQERDSRHIVGAAQASIR